MKQEPFKIVEINSFENFEEEIMNIRRNREPRFTVFRGQASNKWNLIPSLFRKSVEAGNVKLSDLKNLFIEEYTNVGQFVRSGDQMGFSIPGLIYPFLNFKKIEDVKLDEWVNHESPYIEAIALAQHHGVKTRLLDFSYDAYTSLYFAANSSFQMNRQNTSPAGFFSLWMIDGFYLHSPDCKTKMIHTSVESNHYLRAQKGLFISFPNPFEENIEINRDCTEKDYDLLAFMVDDNNGIAKDGNGHKKLFPVIYRFDFPEKQSADIIRKLDSRGFNLISLMPNLDNIEIYNRFKNDVNNKWKEWTPPSSGKFCF